MKAQPPLKVSLHGMNNKMQSMIEAYLQLNCQSLACVVKEFEADAEIVDLDSLPSDNILEERLGMQPPKPIIAISLYDLPSNEATHVRKPVKADDLVDAINWAKKKVFDKKMELKKEIKVTYFSPDISLSSPTINKPDNKVGEKRNGLVSMQSVKKKTPSATTNAHNKVVELNVNIKNDDQKIEKLEPKKTSSAPNSAFPIPYIEEIDKFLKELNQKVQKKVLTPNFSANSRRASVRYMMFQKVKGRLISSIFGVSQSSSVVVQVISSKGALVEIDKPLKPKKKITLKIKFDSEHVFTIQAIVVRKSGPRTYALSFVEYQHEMTEYLISSGYSFDIIDDATAG
jgi:hypothetical protein